MHWEFKNSDTLKYLGRVWSTLGIVVPSIDLTVDVVVPWNRKGKIKEDSPSTEHNKSCTLAPGNMLVWSMMLGRSSNAPFAATVLYSFLSLVVWTVAVLGLHHLRYSQRTNPDDQVLQAAFKFWQPQGRQIDNIDSLYRLDLSTEENYKAGNDNNNEDSDNNFCGSKFASIRSELDYNFHSHYRCERIMFQDDIIESRLLHAPTTKELDGHTCTAGKHWAVFTAGVMGAGKSYTIRKLDEKGRFPLSQFVVVDPDSIRRQLPEFERYVQAVPERAGELTRKEAGKISEILSQAALERGQNVLVDGTLRNSTWYQEYFQELRERYPQLQIGILHVTAPREAILERAMSRAKVTGRVVPIDLLERNMLEVPDSIKALSPLVDFAVELRNSPGSTDIEIVTPSVNWSSFKKVWKQSLC
ncbi:Zeta toxin [Seminavis robusta]|uniref:Zeta toxin n=1 Tax=Seminavis robusta TaxID=568900 RepID=A0A9N8EY41_9STRA|nr:Zeta toxin [Seminavis robusta]|eukprot:Sro2426_g327290.1 Zeta toxin (415) ;mRNA; r:3817-5158